MALEVKFNKGDYHLLAVYGTLRKGEYNNYLLKGAELVDTVVTKEPFTMYTNGSYPILTQDRTSYITVELYKITDQETLRRIYGLEGYSGIRGDATGNWYDTMDIDTKHGKAEIFYMTNFRNTSYNVVKSGDWKQR